MYNPMRLTEHAACMAEKRYAQKCEKKQGEDYLQKLGIDGRI
jgi:hypothetical protein